MHRNRTLILNTVLSVLDGLKIFLSNTKPNSHPLRIKPFFLRKLCTIAIDFGPPSCPTSGFCDEVLLEEPGNVKALYRKADALGQLPQIVADKKQSKNNILAWVRAWLMSLSENGYDDFKNSMLLVHLYLLVCLRVLFAFLFELPN